MPANKHNHIKVVQILLLLASLVSCQSGPDPAAVGSFGSPRQFHVAFIDTYTAGPSKQWDDVKLQADIDRGETLFNSAMGGVTDKKRAEALNILHRQFQKDYAFLKQRAKESKPFFSVTMAQEKKQVIQENYDLATKGELVRF